jgi:arylsulfatase A-like enzyme
MPTLCGLAAYKLEQDLRWDGVDLWPSLTGQAAPPARAVYLAAPGFRSRMIREGDWKLVVREKPAKAELYNVATDPSEKTDLAEKEPAKVAQLRQRLAEQSSADNDRKVSLN